MKTRAFLFLIVFSACRKDPAIWRTDNLNGNIIGIIGHGGMGIHSSLPLNSIASLQEAIDENADGIEMDVQMSKDSVLFLFHSNDLAEASHCSGRIHEMNASEINCRYRGTIKMHLVERLDDVLERLEYSRSTQFIFECKIPDHPTEQFLNTFANRLLLLLRKYQIMDQSMVEATHSDYLEIIGGRDSVHPRLFIYTNDFHHGMETAQRLRLYGITMDLHLMDASQVNAAHRLGFRVSLFNQKTEKDNLDAIALGPDFIQTDKLKHLVRILKN